MFSRIEDVVLRDKVIGIFEINKELYRIPASVNHHHTETGGLYRHLDEVSGIVYKYYEKENYAIPRDRMIMLAICHDLDRLGKYLEIAQDSWKRKPQYRERYGEWEQIQGREWVNETAKTVAILAQHGIHLSEPEIHVLTFHHGGWAPDREAYGPKSREAVLLHFADMMSLTY